LLSSPDATFIEAVSQACVIRVSPRWRWVVSHAIADRRCRRCRWQVGPLTKIGTGMGSVMIDLTEAEFDDWDVEIIVQVHMGQITVIAPRGLDVRQVGTSGAVSSALEQPIRASPSCGSAHPATSAQSA
jgi:hypothetical protein